MSGFMRERAAWARMAAAGETGDTMIEVIVAALLVALIAAGVLTGFGQVSTLSGGQRQRVQATALAQQDQARLRGLALTQLSGVTGNTGSTQVLDGTTYTVTSKSTFITGTGAATCTAGQSGASADMVAISSTVTWPNMGKRPPVVIHSVVAPPVGGALVVSATTPIVTGTTGSSGVTGLPGLTATLTGPSTTSPLTTDSVGCAIFAGLTAGSYTLNMTPPAGYVDKDGNTTLATQTPTITATQTLYANAPTLAQPGAIAASFQTTYNLGATGGTGATGATGATGSTTVVSQGDQFSLSEGNQLTPSPRLFGTDSTPTNNSFAATVNSGMTVYPTATPLTANYTVESGSCNDAPAGGQVSASVTSGQTTNVTLPQPAMIILPYSAPGTVTNWTQDDNVASSANATITYANPAGAWASTSPANANYFGSSENESSTTNSTVTVTFTGTAIAWIATTRSNEGYASVKLDGSTVSGSPFNLYSPTTAYRQTIWSVSGLTQGSHTVVITVTGQNGTLFFGGHTVSVDEFTGSSVTGLPILMTTRPNIVVTDTGTGCGNAADYPPTQVPTASAGALKFPGLPYGTYTICVDDLPAGGTTHHQTVTGVANTDYTQGNVVNVNFYSGASGYASGACQSSPSY